jgi:hypothetical protein
MSVKRREWTAAEEKRILALSSMMLPLTEIAMKMGRSTGSCSAKINQLRSGLIDVTIRLPPELYDEIVGSPSAYVSDLIRRDLESRRHK